MLKTSVEEETRFFRIIPAEDGGMKKYFLDSNDTSVKIKVICLKDYITQKLQIALLDQ